MKSRMKRITRMAIRKMRFRVVAAVVAVAVMMDMKKVIVSKKKRVLRKIK